MRSRLEIASTELAEIADIAFLLGQEKLAYQAIDLAFDALDSRDIIGLSHLMSALRLAFWTHGNNVELSKRQEHLLHIVGK